MFNYFKQIIFTAHHCIWGLPSSAFEVHHYKQLSYPAKICHVHCYKNYYCYNLQHIQAQIHTSFHRFTEIGQIFHKYIFNKKTFQVETW